MRRNPLEWLVLVVSLIAVIGLVGYLVVDGLIDGGGPALIRTEAIISEGTHGVQGWSVPVIVENVGDRAAVGLVVEGTADVGGALETSQLTVDVLAAGSRVELMLGFSDVPTGDVSVRVVGFEVP